MKILLAVDGSPHSKAAIVDVARGSWPDGTAIDTVAIKIAFHRETGDYIVQPTAHSDRAIQSDFLLSTGVFLAQRMV